jgi:hypothetical protein
MPTWKVEFEVEAKTRQEVYDRFDYLMDNKLRVVQMEQEEEMDEKERWETIDKIVERAREMDIAIGTRVTQMMDITNADKQFHLRLKEFLNADGIDFAHDFRGIQNHMDRNKCKVVDLFVPRFAGTV